MIANGYERDLLFLERQRRVYRKIHRTFLKREQEGMELFQAEGKAEENEGLPAEWAVPQEWGR